MEALVWWIGLGWVGMLAGGSWGERMGGVDGGVDGVVLGLGCGMVEWMLRE